MAVDKMKLISICGSIRDLDEAARIIVLNGKVHMLNAISELKSGCFGNVEGEKSQDDCIELEFIRPYIAQTDFSEDEKIIKALHDLLNIKQEVHREYMDPNFDYHHIMDNLKVCYDTVKSTVERIEELNKSIELKQEHLKNLQYAHHEDVDVGSLLQLKNFEFEMMTLSREKYKKLKLNYENIPAVVFHLGVMDDHDIIAVVTPLDKKEESERIFTSLNVMELNIPRDYEGSTEIMIRTLQKDIYDMKKEIHDLKDSVQWSRVEYYDTIQRAYNALVLNQKLNYVKSEVALGENLFYMFGFVPARDVNKLKQEIEGNFADKYLLMFDAVENRKYGHSPPTKLVNNILFRPFESLVMMYGIPNYNEKDPTPFFAISYMLLFGAMFGDLGQGFIILLGGLILRYIMGNASFGGILSRLGISSMFFGLMYGSVFGNEEIIHHVLISPMEDMNTILISAVVLGIALINIGYIYSLINLYNRRDLEEGIFGREGLVGYLFFWVLILFIWDKVTNVLGLPTVLYIIAMAATLLLMVFKQPLAHKIQGNDELYEHSAVDYYTEAGFGVIETIMAVASNVISFIRVGAFALNHVGLYIAFATMAEMVESRAAGLLILIIGNIIIIGLEGLIVFIQCLRLEYYELFSKYYSGYGVPYMPAQISNQDDE